MDPTIELNLTANLSGHQGFATVYMQVQNSDGTAPSMVLNPANSQAVALVQPVANDGADPDFPAATYPWVGVVQAQNLAPAGALTIELWSDGVKNQSIPCIVNPPAQTVSVTQASIVVTPAD